MDRGGPEILDATSDTASVSKPTGRRAAFKRGVCIGRYVVLDRIGEGGMGVVYKAYDPELERPVALKLLHAGGGEDSSAAALRRDRLLREAKALGRLSHPNVLAVFDVGTYEADVFLATEFVEGPTLRDWLREEKRSRFDVLRAFLAAGEGLAAAHRAGLVHRDFKPANVMVGSDGRVRVLDFGVARLDVGDESIAALPSPSPRSFGGNTTTSTRKRDSGTTTKREGRGASSAPPPPAIAVPLPGGSSQSLPAPSISISSSPKRLLTTQMTEEGQLVGTPRYMAPEQHLGEIVSARADQFAFGISLYEALYGEPPFAGAAESYVQQVVAGQVRPAPAGSDVPRWLRQVLLRALSPEPADRHASMDALLADLRRDPTVARRRGAAIAAALILLAIIALVYRRETHDASMVCSGAERKLAGVWDEPRKSAMKHAFEATRSPFATDALARASAVLDSYTGAWVAVHRDACEATRLRGEQSEELLDLRMECLSERLEEVRAQVDVFAQADAKGVEKAVQAARALPRLEGCSDAAALRAPLRPPSDPAIRGRVDAVRSGLAAARALQRTGQYADALVLASKADVEATGIAYRPVEAEAKYLVGDLQDDVGDYAGSEKTFERAAAAGLAGRHDAIATRAFAALVVAVGLRQARFGEAHAWALLAEAAGERPGTDALVRGEVQRNLGRVLLREGKLPESRASIERCLALWRPVLGPEDLSIAGPLTDLGNVFFTIGDDAGAIARYVESLAILEKALGSEHPYLGPNLNNLGEVYERRGDYVHAEEALTRALHVWERALGPDHPKVGMAVYNLGQVVRSRGELERAMAYAERALAIYTKALGAEHPDVAMAHDGIAAVLRAQGPSKLAAARSEYEIALALREKALGKDHTDVGESLVGLGEVRLEQGAAVDAVALLERAYVIFDGGKGEPPDFAAASFALARALSAAHRDPKRVKALTAQARQVFASAESPLGAAHVATVDAWLPGRP